MQEDINTLKDAYQSVIDGQPFDTKTTFIAQFRTLIKVAEIAQNPPAVDSGSVVFQDVETHEVLRLKQVLGRVSNELRCQFGGECGRYLESMWCEHCKLREFIKKEAT